MSAEATQLLLMKGMLVDATEDERELVDMYRKQTLEMLNADPHAAIGMTMAMLEFTIEEEKK